MPVKKKAPSSKTSSRTTSRTSSRGKKAPVKKTSSRTPSRGKTSSRDKSPVKKAIVVKSAAPGKVLDFSKMTIQQLKKEAAKQKIKVAPNATKPALLKALHEKSKKTVSPPREAPPPRKEESQTVEESSSEEDLDMHFDASKLTPKRREIADGYKKMSISKLKENCKEHKLGPKELKGKKCDSFTSKNRGLLEKSMLEHRINQLKEEQLRLEKKLREERESRPKETYNFSDEKWKTCEDSQSYYIPDRGCADRSVFRDNASVRTKEYESGGKKYSISGTEDQLADFERYFNQRTVTPPRTIQQPFIPPKSATPPRTIQQPFIPPRQPDFTRSTTPPKPKEWWQQGCFDENVYDAGVKKGGDKYRCIAEEKGKPAKGYEYDKYSDPNFATDKTRYVLEVTGGRKIYGPNIENLKLLQDKMGGVIKENRDNKRWIEVGKEIPKFSSDAKPLESAERSDAPVFGASLSSQTPNPFAPVENKLSPARSSSLIKSTPSGFGVTPSSTTVAPPQVKELPPSDKEEQLIKDVRAEFARCLKSLSLEA